MVFPTGGCVMYVMYERNYISVGVIEHGGYPTSSYTVTFEKLFRAFLRKIYVSKR